MTKGFIFLQSAEDDITEIMRYISYDSPQAATAFREAVESACERFVILPEMGSTPDALSRYSILKGVRVLPLQRFEKYLLFYRPVMDGKIEIVRVVHGARDLPALFEDKKRAKETEEV